MARQHFNALITIGHAAGLVQNVGTHGGADGFCQCATVLFIANNQAGRGCCCPFGTDTVKVQKHHAKRVLIYSVVGADHTGADVLRVVCGRVALGIFVRFVEVHHTGFFIVALH